MINLHDSSPLSTTQSHADTCALRCPNDVYLDGRVVGDVHCGGRVIVGEDSEVFGNVYGRSAEILGVVHGTVIADEVELWPGCAILSEPERPEERQRSHLRVVPPIQHADVDPPADFGAQVDPPQALPSRVTVDVAAPQLRPVGLAPLQSNESAPPPPGNDFDHPISGRSFESSVEVNAGPFDRFSRLAEFTHGLGQMTGVGKITTLQFYRGYVKLRVEHTGPVPLAQRIAAELAQMDIEVQERAGRVEVELKA
ncbi:MAG: polymer-forming cytoskeletal protein [Chloroflexi bacterium]|nr:polymer-forming cytoskeletal protein [Chloroflexota bacterium]